MCLATREKILYPIIALIMVGLVFLAWDHHMQGRWDDHIVSNSPTYFYMKRKKENDPSPFLYEVDLSSVPDGYKMPLEIVERDGSYYWVNNDNLPLKKIIEYQPLTENGITNDKGFKWIVFSNADNSIKIKIQANDYLHWNEAGEYGCFPRSWQGNVSIQYNLAKNDFNKIAPQNPKAYKDVATSFSAKDVYLVASANTNVYENAVQNYYCNP